MVLSGALACCGGVGAVLGEGGWMVDEWLIVARCGTASHSLRCTGRGKK